MELKYIYLFINDRYILYNLLLYIRIGACKMAEKYIFETQNKYKRGESIIEGKILVIGDDYLPYDFMSWREAANFLIDKCYGMKRAMTLLSKDKEHLEMRCPLTGEYLTVLGDEDDLEYIHTTFILQNLYRRERY